MAVPWDLPCHYETAVAVLWRSHVIFTAAWALMDRHGTIGLA